MTMKTMLQNKQKKFITAVNVQIMVKERNQTITISKTKLYCKRRSKLLFA